MSDRKIIYSTAPINDHDYVDMIKDPEPLIKPFNNEVPIGTVSTHQGPDVPKGWLECNGQRVFKTDYPELAKVCALDNGRGGVCNVPDMTHQYPDMKTTLLDDDGEPIEEPKEFTIKSIIKAK